MFEAKVPALWMGKSYPNEMPLGSYVNDLIERIEMLTSWVANGPPIIFWIPGFYFTHAFLTGVKQNYARKDKVPIDKISFKYECLRSDANFKVQPENGAYVRGMFIEGARWDNESMVLEESNPKVQQDLSEV